MKSLMFVPRYGKRRKDLVYIQFIIHIGTGVHYWWKSVFSKWLWNMEFSCSSCLENNTNCSLDLFYYHINSKRFIMILSYTFVLFSVKKGSLRGLFWMTVHDHFTSEFKSKFDKFNKFCFKPTLYYMPE